MVEQGKDFTTEVTEATESSRRETAGPRISTDRNRSHIGGRFQMLDARGGSPVVGRWARREVTPHPASSLSHLLPWEKVWN